MPTVAIKVPHDLKKELADSIASQSDLTEEDAKGYWG